jgi:hypothetical protein
MKGVKPWSITMKLEKDLDRLYWFMRIGMAFIWTWTAIASWFLYPQAESLDWLRRVGIVRSAQTWLAAACLFDLVLGIASAIFARRIIWHAQIFIVGFYTLVIAFGLPEFLIQPFGPITKNIAVLGCLYYLAIMEKS